MKAIFLGVFLFKAGIIFADDCKSLSKEEVFDYADIIFLGHVFDAGDSTYMVKISEWFKGIPRDTLTGVITQDVIPPEIGSIWLIFGQSLTDNRFLADVCSGSKSLDLPYGSHDITIPIIPPPEMYGNPAQLALLKEIELDKALNEFYYDVASLRARKFEEENKSIRQSQSQMEVNYTKLEQDVKFIKWSILILLLAFVLSILIRLRCK